MIRFLLLSALMAVGGCGLAGAYDLFLSSDGFYGKSPPVSNNRVGSSTIPFCSDASPGEICKEFNGQELTVWLGSKPSLKVSVLKVEWKCSEWCIIRYDNGHEYPLIIDFNFELDSIKGNIVKINCTREIGYREDGIVVHRKVKH